MSSSAVLAGARPEDGPRKSRGSKSHCSKELLNNLALASTLAISFWMSQMSCSVPPFVNSEYYHQQHFAYLVHAPTTHFDIAASSPLADAPFHLLSRSCQCASHHDLRLSPLGFSRDWNIKNVHFHFERPSDFTIPVVVVAVLLVSVVGRQTSCDAADRVRPCFEWHPLFPAVLPFLLFFGSVRPQA